MSDLSKMILEIISKKILHKFMANIQLIRCVELRYLFSSIINSIICSVRKKAHQRYTSKPLIWLVRVRAIQFL